MIFKKRTEKSYYGEKRLEKFWNSFEADERYRLVQYEIGANGKLTGGISYLGVVTERL